MLFATFTARASESNSILLRRGISYDYGDSGNLVSITYVDGSAETFTYDAVGNLLTHVTESRLNSQGAPLTNTYEYDPISRVTKAVDAEVRLMTRVASAAP